METLIHLSVFGFVTGIQQLIRLPVSSNAENAVVPCGIIISSVHNVLYVIQQRFHMVRVQSACSLVLSRLKVVVFLCR
jgi:hypothetical protein